MHYLITHGFRNEGINPGHTVEGMEQLCKLAIPDDITGLVVGTGRRFNEIVDVLYQRNKILGLTGNVKHSPFCGGAEGLDPPGNVVLAHGLICDLENYIGLANTPGFNPWAFVAGQPDGTLFCAGGELTAALGVAKPAKGALYKVDVAIKTATLIAQG